MIDSRIEGFILACIVLILFAALRHSENPTQIEQWSSAVTTFLLVSAIFIIYDRIRNRFFINKLYYFISQNDYDAATDLLQKAIKRQPKILWLKIEQVVVFGLFGKLDAFYSELEVVGRAKSVCKQTNYYNLEVLNVAISCLLGMENTMDLKKTLKLYPQKQKKPNGFSILFETIQSYLSNDFEKTIEFANYLYSLKTNFFKFFAALILTVSYSQINEFEKALIFKQEYLNNPLIDCFGENR